MSIRSHLGSRSALGVACFFCCAHSISIRAMPKYEYPVDPHANFKFDLDKLLSKRGHAIVLSLIKCAKDILANDMFRTGLIDIQRILRHTFKDTSNEGMVWFNHKTRWVDVGNYQYAVLYQFLWRVAREVAPDELNLMTEVSVIYPSLAYNATPTANSFSMKGDVIEYMLSFAMMDGPAISPRTKVLRQSFNSSIRTFSQQYEVLTHIITRDNDGPPRLRHFPPPDTLVTICLFGKLVVESHQYQEQLKWREQFNWIKIRMQTFQAWEFDVT